MATQYTEANTNIYNTMWMRVGVDSGKYYGVDNFLDVMVNSYQNYNGIGYSLSKTTKPNLRLNRIDPDRG